MKRKMELTELTSFQYNIAAIIYVIMHSLIIYVITYNKGTREIIKTNRI